MAEISIPSKNAIRDAIVYDETQIQSRDFRGQTDPIRIYFMPETTTVAGLEVAYKPYTDEQVQADPNLALLNASYRAIRLQDRQNVLNNVFAVWARQANISFVETTDPAQAQIRVGAGNWTGNASVNVPGHAPSGRVNSVFIRTDFYNPGADAMPQFAAGSRQTHDLIHEVGHAIGLNHPTVGQEGGTLASAFNDMWFSVMTNNGPNVAGWGPVTPSLFDTVGLEALYGLRSVNDTDNHVIADGTGRLIIDSGGIDTLDASGTATANEIDLRATDFAAGKAYFSSIGLPAGYKPRYNVALYEGTQIENATGGSGADLIIGNDADNALDGGVTRNNGAQPKDKSLGADTLKGGAGADTYLFAGKFGHDVVEDVSGTLKFDGVALSGTMSKLSGGIWKDDTGRTKLFWSPAADGKGDLLITRFVPGPNGKLVVQGSVTVKNFANGDLGLNLAGVRVPVPSTESGSIDVWLSDPRNNAMKITVAGTNYTDLAAVRHWIDASSAANQIVLGDGNDFVNVGASYDAVKKTWGTEDEDYVSAGGGDDTVRGGFGSDVLDGGAGHDTIYGSLAGADWLVDGGAYTSYDPADKAHGDLLDGGDGADQLFGSQGDDVLYGGAVADGANGLEGGDLLAGGDGDDALAGDGAYVPSGDTAIRRGFIGSIFYADGGNDTLFGGRGNDRLKGGVGDDELIGGDGDDQLFADTDTYNDDGESEVTAWIPGGLHGADTLDGGDGNDYLLGGGSSDYLAGGAGNDSLVGDQFNADTASIAMQYHGDDYLDGGEGRDTLYGDGGNDVLVGGGHRDSLFGGLGDDVYRASAGDFTDGDHIDDSGGVDRIEFAADVNEADFAVRRQGGDLLLLLGSAALVVQSVFDGGNGAIESVSFADGTVRDFAQLKALAVQTSANHDRVQAIEAGQIIDAGAGDDWLWTGSEGNILLGGAGKDFLKGGGGNDVLDGGAGDDTLRAGAGADTLIGGAGRDYLYGQAGGNTTFRFDLGDGQDVIDEARGFDVVEFGEGITPDQVILQNISTALKIIVNGGDSIVVGGMYAGNDENYKLDAIEQIRFADGTTWDDRRMMMETMKNIDEANLIWGTKAGDIIDAGAGNDTIEGEPGDDHLFGSIGDDRLYGGSGADVLAGGLGNDFLSGHEGDDILKGDAGNDVLTGGAGNDAYLFGDQDGTDTIFSRSSPSEEAGFDVLRLTGSWTSANTLIRRVKGSRFNTDIEIYRTDVPDKIIVNYFYDDSEVLNPAASIERIEFADGTSWDAAKIGERAATSGAGKTLVGNEYANTLFGDVGNDTLDGQQGADTLSGGAGDDLLVGGSGNDLLNGGSGSDTAVFSGRLEDYSLLSYQGLLYVGDTVAGRDGIDRLFGVEKLVFSQSPGTVYTASSLKFASPLEYIASFPDLIAAFGANPTAGIVHYTQYGVAQGRRASFDGLSYLASYADLASTLGVNIDAAAAHYIRYGRAEGRTVRIAAQDLVDAQGAHAYVQHGADGDDAMRSLGAGTANTLFGLGGSDTLTGGAGTDVLDGGIGADTLAGGAGSDTYLLARGHGADRIGEDDATTGNTDIALFGAGIATDQLWFRQVGNDLEISVIGGTDQFTVGNWYQGSQHHVEQFKTSDGKVLLDSQVQSLVEAMAAFAPPAAGQTTLPSSYQSALAPMIAANWH